MKKRKEKPKYVARPGIEPRTPDLRVRCPTDCTTSPTEFLVCFPFYCILHRNSCKANSADPKQMQQNMGTGSELGLHCLYNTLKGASGLKRVKVDLSPSVMFGIFVHFLEIHFSPYLTVISVSKKIKKNRFNVLKRMGNLSREETMLFSFLPHFCMGVNSKRKEFAPLEASSFL